MESGLFSPLATMLAHRDGGQWAGLSPWEMKVLTVFYTRADNLTGESFVTVAGIAADLRTAALPRVRKGLKALEDKGLLVVVSQGGGRGHSTVRRLAVPPPLPRLPATPSRRRRPVETGTDAVPVSTGQTGTACVPLSTPETGTASVPVIGKQTGTVSTINRYTFDAQTGTDAVPPTSYSTNSTTKHAGGEAEAEDLESRIRRYVARHPSLIPSAKLFATVGRLVEAVGWDRATDLIDEGAAAGKSFPVSWALAKAEGQSREAAGGKFRGRPGRPPARPEPKPGRHVMT